MLWKFITMYDNTDMRYWVMDHTKLESRSSKNSIDGNSNNTSLNDRFRIGKMDLFREAFRLLPCINKLDPYVLWKLFSPIRDGPIEVVVRVSLPVTWPSLRNLIGCMMTSSNGNIFRVTGHLCGEFISYRWIPLTNASDAELWWFLCSAPEQTVE